MAEVTHSATGQSMQGQSMVNNSIPEVDGSIPAYEIDGSTIEAHPTTIDDRSWTEKLQDRQVLGEVRAPSNQPTDFNAGTFSLKPSDSKTRSPTKSQGMMGAGIIGSPYVKESSPQWNNLNFYPSDTSQGYLYETSQ